jgi:hypothetical protein
MPPALLLLALLVAQDPASSTAPSQPKPFGIVDNSFLVEEAFNQEPKIFQNIFGFTRLQGNWGFTFTQEWPAPGTRHQLSYTIPINSAGTASGLGSVLINYRLQVLEEGPGRPAFSPRVSAVLPTGADDFGGDSAGVQVNLPFSKQQGDFYFHWNGGFTLVRNDKLDFFSPSFAGSTIYRLEDMCNLMLESVLSYVDTEIAPDRTRRIRQFTLSPGIRGGWNLGPDTQIIIGAAIPVLWTDRKTYAGVFGYFSYELPFKK